MPENSKENRLNLNQYNLQDILEPLAKASAGTARSQYLSVSRYIAGQPSGIRRASNILGSDSRKNSGLYKQSGSIDSESPNKNIDYLIYFRGTRHSFVI